MRYLTHRDDLDEYLTSSSSVSEEAHHALHRPQRVHATSTYDQGKQSPVTQTTRSRGSYLASRRNRDERPESPHYAYDDSTRYQARRSGQQEDRSISRGHGRRDGSRARHDPDREARRARRIERRKSRAARDPEGEARRQERRQQRRQQRVSSPDDQDLESDAHRRDRRASRRAERDASRWKGTEARKNRVPSRREIDRRGPPKRNSFEADYLAHMKRQDPGAGPAYIALNETSQSSGDDWSADLEKSSVDERNSRSTSMYDELQWYKRGMNPDDRERYDEEMYRRRGCCGTRRRCCIISLVAAALIIIVIVVVVPVMVTRKNGYSYHPSTAQVNNTAAFTDGAATRNGVNNTNDGVGAGSDTYRYYQGNAAQFPNQTSWVSFEHMWESNKETIQQSCAWLKYGENNSDADVQDIYNAIQDRANASLVDHRFILAVIMQESKGCVHVPHTTSYGGIRNTGLMQAHNGVDYDSSHGSKSILHMVQDGVQGTSNGPGLVQILNTDTGNPYVAARWYNSGNIAASGDLSDGAGATACYVSDIANRLTGWVYAKSTCPGDTS